MPNIGPLELAIVLIIVLLVFGPKRLPGLGRQLGSGMREFKDSVTGKDKDDDDGMTAGDHDAFGDARRIERGTTAPGATATPPAEAEPEVVSGEARHEDPAPARREP